MIGLPSMRMLAGLLILATFLAWCSASQAQTAQEKAALILFKSGKEKFKKGDLQGALPDLERAFNIVPADKRIYVQYYLALTYERTGNCEKARPLLESLKGRVEGPQEDARKEAMARCLLDQVETLTRNGDCDQANRILESVPHPVSHEIDARRESLFGGCEVAVARTLMEKGQCKKALAVLEAPTTRFSASNEAAAQEIARRCRRVIVGFDNKTAVQKAAWILVESAISLMDSGKPDKAIPKLVKALKVYDEPHIHKHAARAFFQVFDCPRAVQNAARAADALPEFREEAGRIEAWCETFYIPPDAPIHRPTRKLLMGRYMEAWVVGTRDRAESLSRLIATLDTWDNPKVRLYIGRELVRQRRYADALKMLEPLRGKLPDRQWDVNNMIELARFGVADLNPQEDKAALFERWKKAEGLLEQGKYDEAEKLLVTVSHNPFVARTMARIHAHEGDCRAQETDLSWLTGDFEDKAFEQKAKAECADVEGRRKAEQARRERELEEAAKAAALRRSLQSIRKRKILGWCLVGGGVALIGTSGYFFWRYFDARSSVRSAKSDYDTAVDQAGFDEARDRANAAISRARTNSIVGYVLAGAGAAIGVWGVATLLTMPDAPSTAAVLPMLGPGATGVVLRGRF